MGLMGAGEKMRLKLIHAVEKKEIFPELKKAVLPEEKFCSDLYERIVMQDEGIHALYDDDGKMHGIICLSRGSTFTCCVPKWTKDVKMAIGGFLGGKKISCVHGEESAVIEIERILEGVSSEKECRNLFVMEYQGLVTIRESGWKIHGCGKDDVERLMPLQAGFYSEEVLPAWKELNLPLIRMKLERDVKSSAVYALGDGERFCAKANVSSHFGNVIQISGVYTEKGFRGKGCAATLVNRIALMAGETGRNATLLVRQENLSAYNAYKKAGFGISGTYRIVYFR